MVILVVIAFIMVSFFEIPGLIQKKYWPELTVFSILLLMGFGLSLLLLAGVNTPYIFVLISQGIKRMFSMK
jgi:hypothetical protein